MIQTHKLFIAKIEFDQVNGLKTKYAEILVFANTAEQAFTKLSKTMPPKTKLKFPVREVPMYKSPHQIGTKFYLK